MTFRETFFNVKQMAVDRLQDFGLESASMEMGWTTMLSIQQNTRLTIDVPLVLTYSDAFIISGALETSTYSRLNGKTVKLKVGGTIVDTTTTNVNGEYSFTQTPVSTGIHSFQVIFEGTNIHNGSESSVVTRTPQKETTVMNLNAQTIKHYGDTAVLGGTLLTDDGEYVSGASIKYYNNNTLISTLTTDAYGRFSVNKTIDTFDTITARFVYEGNSNYVNTSASQNITVYQMNLSLTSDKNILSYADGDSATITAQLIDDAPVPQILEIANQSIYFYDGGYDSSYSLDTTHTIHCSVNSSANVINIDFEIIGAIQIGVQTSDTNFRTVYTDTSIFNEGAPYNIYWSPNDNSFNIVNTAGLVVSETISNVERIFILNPDASHTASIYDFSVSHKFNTDSNGQAEFIYNSQGVGDITITAELDSSNLVSKTYSIRDGIFYDVSSSSNVSKYGSSSAFSYDTTEQAYYITTSSAKNITRESVVGDFDFEVSMDFKIASIGTLFYVGESTSGYECQTEIAYQSSAKRVSTFYVNSSQSVNGRTIRTNYNFDTSKWYHLKITRVGNVLTAQILDGDTIVATAIDNNVVGTNLNVAWHNYVTIGTMYWKNILFIRL